MFPNAIPPRDDDLNRRPTTWQPGQSRPKTVTAGVIIAWVVSALLVLTGILLLQLRWDRAAANPEEAATMAFVLRNVKILGGLQVVFGILIAWASLGLWRGRKGSRKWMAIAAGLEIFFLLAGWVLRFTPTGQALMALGLAIVLLLIFRPGVAGYFQQSPDKNLKEEELRGE